MSYDIHIGDFCGNYTSNCSALWYDHMPDGLRGIDGMTGKQAGDHIANGLNSIHRSVLDVWKNGTVGEPLLCAKYDAPNGWGSTVGALIFMCQVMAACYQNPRKRVRVSA